MESVAERNCLSSVFSVVSHTSVVHFIVLVYFKGVFWVAGCFVLFIEGVYVMQECKGD